MQPDRKEFERQAPPDRGASCFIYPPTGANLSFFADVLERGGVVAIPTETVYGLAGLAMDEKACRSIFTIKGRPLMDPLIIHVANFAIIDQFAHVPPALKLINSKFWPGPLTVILRKKPVVPDLVTAGKPTVAIRIPRHPVAHSLLEMLGKPLAAPSANPFGYVSPSRAEHVAASFGEKVPYILDGGPCDIGLESTILDLSTGERAEILRPGAVSSGELESALEMPVTHRRVSVGGDEAATAPGTMQRHYSPRTSLVLFDQGTAPEREPADAALYLNRPAVSDQENVFWLSENGDPSEIAKALFAMLRSLDRTGFDRIHCEVPGVDSMDVLFAVRDRLQRAASK